MNKASHFPKTNDKRRQSQRAMHFFVVVCCSALTRHSQMRRKESTSSKNRKTSSVRETVPPQVTAILHGSGHNGEMWLSYKVAVMKTNGNPQDQKVEKYSWYKKRSHTSFILPIEISGKIKNAIKSNQKVKKNKKSKTAAKIFSFHFWGQK